MKMMKAGVLILGLSWVMSAQSPATTITAEQAIREALANNLDLAAARYNISIAEARQITARLRPNPVLTLSADHLDLLGTGYSILNNAGPPEYSSRTDFVLERGGKRTARIELAAAEKSLAELGFSDAIRRTIFDVQGALVDLQAAKESLALANDNLRSLNGIVTINTARVNSGDLSRVELERSEVAAMQYLTAVRQAELQVRQAKSRLLLLLGRKNPAEEIDVIDSIRRDTGEAVELESVRTRAGAQRPDLLAARRTQPRNLADLRLQLAQGKIDYTTGVEYRRQQGIAGTGNSLGFFISTPLPVFNRNQGEIERARREVDQAAAQIRAIEARVNAEATAAWQQYSTSRGLLENIERQMLGKARQVRQTTEYSYRRGEASLVEFLDAQRAFNDVMQSYNDARANYARSLYLIDSVTAANIAGQ